MAIAVAAGRTVDADPGGQILELRATRGVVLLVAIGPATDGDDVGMGDHLVLRDIDIPAVATRPEDGAPQPLAAIGRGVLDGHTKRIAQIPLGPIGAEAGHDEVRATVCWSTGDFVRRCRA